MKSFFLLSVLSFYSVMAVAFPLPKSNRIPLILPETLTADYDFTGIVGLSNCSGSLVRLENSSDDDLGLAFTNGHCYEGGFVPAGTFVYDKPSTRKLTIYGLTTATTYPVTAQKVVYSTMTKTDVTIYKLSLTYRQIREKSGIEPVTLSSTKPSSTLPIEIISGYWKKGYRCNLNGFAYKLKESSWTWEDSLRYSATGCEIIGGTSGSPILEASTRKMIGINNTGNEEGEKCTLNNPCEEDENGNITFKQGQNYGQQTYWVYSCLNPKNSFDPNISGCQLPH
jgi:hypothetical protein